MSGLARIIGQRLAAGALALLLASMAVFAAVEAFPGPGAPPEADAAPPESPGADASPVERYFIWLGGALGGDFRAGFRQPRYGQAGEREAAAATGPLAPRLANTLFLVAAAAAAAAPLALAFGIPAALYRGSIFDRAAQAGALTSISGPEFFVAYILILLLAAANPVFPPLSQLHADLDFGERLTRTALPALTLALIAAARMMRMTRAAVLDLMALHPVEAAARPKGAARRRAALRHVLPKAAAPIAHAVALNLACLMTGAVVVEAVFAYPGIGRMFVDAVTLRDMPAVQACCLVFIAAHILLNLLAAVLAALANPRLRRPE